ncbi:MAG: hypothetical protein APR63_09115 [Desulfuromonas sp. SDB]|nr:MAG: hypothetical protein APR63_09115 [Desulfuromonas sp. SDB]
MYKVKDLLTPSFPIKSLKIYNSDRSGKENLKLFINDFLYTKSIYLPNVIKVYDFDKIYDIDKTSFSGNYFFYTMEYITGYPLSRYSFKSKKENKNILSKVIFNLNWLHQNGFSHGELNLDNVIIENNDVRFINLNHEGNIHLEKQKFLNSLQQIFNLSKTFIDNNYIKEISESYIKKIYQQRYQYTIELISFLKTDIEQNIKNARENLNQSYAFNYLNFKGTYFEILKQFFCDMFKTNGYRVINISESKNKYSILYFLTYFIDKNLHYQNIIENLNTKYIGLLEDINQGKPVENYQKAFLGDFLCSIVEKLSYFSKMLIIIDNIQNIDRESRDLVGYLFDNYRGNHVIVLVNDSKQYTDNYSIKVFNDYTYPSDQKYKLEIIKIIEKNLSIFNLVNLEFYLDQLNNIDLISTLDYIITNIDSFSSQQKTESEFRRPEKFVDQIVFQNQRIIEYLHKPIYMKTLSFLYYLHRPAPVEILKQLVGKRYADFTENLFKDSLIVNIKGNRIDFHDYQVIRIVENFLENKDEKFISKVLEKVISIYESNKGILNDNDVVGWLQSLALLKKYSKMSSVLYHKYLTADISFYTLKENIGKFLNYFQKDTDNFSAIKNNENKFIFKLSYALIVKKEHYHQKYKLLKILESEYCSNEKFQLLLNLNLIDYYFWAVDYEKVEEYLDKLTKSKNKLNQFHRYYIEYLHIKYLIEKSKFDDALEKIRKLFKQLKHLNNYKKYPNLYLKCLNYLGLLYEKQNLGKRLLNSLKLYLEKAEILNSNQHLFIAHTGLGVYLYYHGFSDDSKEHFEKSLVYAQKTDIYEDMILAYNNLIALEERVDKQKNYLYKALNYTSLIDDKRNIFIVLSNLLSLIDDPREAVKLINKYNNILKKDEILSNGNMISKLSMLLEVLRVFVYQDEMKNIKNYHSIVKNFNIKNYSDEVASLYNLVIITYEFVIYGYSANYFKQIIEILRNINDDIKFSLYEAVFYWYFSYFKLNEIKIFYQDIIKFYTKRNELNSVKNIIIINRTEQENLVKNPKLLFRYINRFSNNYHIIKYLKYLAAIYYAFCLKKLQKQNYKNYISLIMNNYEKQKNKFVNENLIEITFWRKIINLLGEMFPDDVREYYSHRGKLRIIQSDEKKLLEVIDRFNPRDYENFIENILNEMIKMLNYERAAFFETDKLYKPELVVYLDKFMYSRNERFYFNFQNFNPKNQILVENLPENSDQINSYILIPFIDDKLQNRMEIQYNKSNLSTEYSYLEYIKAFIYLDKKHSVESSINKNFLELFKHFISSLWINQQNEIKFMKDKLTGLYFKDVFKSKLSDYIYNIKNPDKKIALIMVDIDYFKKVNDNFGHQRGDEVLHQIAQILEKSIRTSDLIGRYGGEEFIIALLNTNPENAIIVAEKLRNKIEKAKLLGNIDELTISAGISFYPNDSVWIDELIEKADQAMYLSKQKGRNKVFSTLSLK